MALTALAAAVWGQEQEGSPADLRVCVFDNPPIVTTGPGRPRGLAIEILDDVAAREGWRLDYYPSTWPGCLADLEAGRLDLLAGIAYSEERARRYELSRETLVSNYGMVWAAADSGISSLLELDGRRVAIVERNIHTAAFDELMRDFGLTWRQVPERDFAAVLEAVANGAAEAGVVNRLSSMTGTVEEGVRPTGIVFNPIEIRYAAPSGRDPDPLRRIDERLASLKRLPGSHYYRALERWLPGGEPHLPVWWVWALAGVACVLAFAVAATLWLRAQVRRQTRQLRAQAVELSSEVRLRRRAQEDLARAAFRDPLTGLPTRLVLRDRLEQALQEATFRGGRVGLLLLDFDRFQSVNELVGQSAGDELLVRLSGRLRGCLPVTATLGRLLGDQFLVLLPHVEEAPELREVADRLLEACRRPLVSPETSLVVTCSIGGALFPEDAREAEELLAGCEAALQDAKQHGRDSFSRYGAQMSSSGLARRRLELTLRNAIAERRLHVDFQPIISLDSGSVVAAEALVRLRGPDGELVLPEQFVPLAEDRGLISALGRVMLQGAASEAARWTRRGSSQLRLAINVSPHQLEAHDFLDQLDEAIRPTGFSSSRVELELTEGVYLDSLRSRERLLAGLAERGIGLSIDDFGSGYSSLSYLSRLPIETVKIDRSFVQDAPRSRPAAEVVKAVIQLARGLGIHCVAEGIETGAQLAFLRAHGCPLGQGFLVARPMSAVALRDWLDRSQESPPLPAAGGS
ncbi:MAG: EAL domain-containing protein [Thermoanaerobaculia bacterium]